ncbi:type II toxin-antitoxin system ParD family antitoxin [Paraburkholderia fungorum]
MDPLVKSGRYQNAREVLREDLRLMELADTESRAKIEARCRTSGHR